MGTVLIPRVEGADEVREAVAAARFVYDDGPGARGADVGRATRYGAAMEGFPERADATTLVGAQVETAAAVSNLEEILSVPELGFLFVGPSDLSTSMGHPLETGHPEVQETIAAVRDRCIEAGVPVGYPVDTTEDALAAAEAGYRMLRVGDEVTAVRQTLGPRLDAVRERD